MKRFQDKNLTLGTFENEVYVSCPKCSKRAIVSKDDPKNYSSTRRLKCSNCMHSQWGRKESYQVELSCNCSNCGNELKRNIPNVNEPKESISIKCEKYRFTQDYQPRNIRLEWIYEYNGQPTEPYFHLPLWLTVIVKGNSLWAYNYKHLEYLKQYIGADLREKNGRVGWTMVEKLPEWMKSAKNREAVLKGIDKLEKK